MQSVFATRGATARADLPWLLFALDQICGGVVIIAALLLTSYAKAREHDAQARQARDDIRADLENTFVSRKGKARRNSNDTSHQNMLLGSATSDEEGT
jgi:hypothetical protein